MSLYPPPLLLIVVILILAIGSYPINGLNPRKLDDSTQPIPGGEKCGGCSACNNPCLQSPPPPALPPPSPPPPSPPPAPKKPPTPGNYCPPPPPPPPPPSAYIYFTGPPGNLYPVDQYFSGTDRSFVVSRALLVGCGLVGLLAF